MSSRDVALAAGSAAGNPSLDAESGAEYGRGDLYRVRILALLAFFFSFTIGLALVGLSERSRLLEAEDAARNHAAGHSHDIQERLARSLSATYALAAVIRQGNGHIEDFEQLGRQMLSVYGGISSLQLAANGIITAIVPLAGNEKAIGHNLLEDTARNKEARLAVATQKLTLAGPFELVQGGMAVVGRLPVFLPDADDNARFWGFTTALIRIPELLQATNLSSIEQHGYRYQLWRIHPDSGDRQMIARSDDRPLSSPIENVFEVPNGKWTLSVEPLVGWYSPLRIALELAGACFVGALVAMLAHTLLMQPLVLRREVATRTRELADANASLGDEIRVREQAEAALRLSRFSLEQASDALFWITPEARIIDANAAACRTLGYSLEELLQLSVPDVDADYNATAWPQHWAELQRRGSLTFESMQRTRDGRLIPVEIVANHVRFGDDEFNCAFVRDITDRKNHDLDLRIAAIAFDSQEGMTVTDADNVILRVNRAFSEITGYSAEDAIGKTPAVLQSGRHDAQFYRGMWQQLESEKRWAGEIWNRRKNGEIYPEWLTITAVTDTEGKITNYIGAFSDTSERVAAEKKIRNLAFYDPLTKLPNRRLLMDRLQQAMASSNRNLGYGALLFIDLDNFKALNDTRGHDTGDQLLTQAAQRLQSCVRDGDTVARVGGDEFAVILQDLSEDEKQAATQVEMLAEKIRRALNQPYSLLGGQHHSTSSIGISLFVDHEIGIEELLKRADTAMYEAKAAGRDTARFFDPAIQAALEVRMALESDLRHALPQREFQLYYQLQVDSARRPIGAEALLRWHHPQRGLVSPADFVPLAEASGQIIQIGQWVLETACAQLKRWEADPLTCDLQLAVNVSARQFREANFVSNLRTLIEHSGIQPEKLKLELTESVVLDNVTDTIEKMRVIREMGIIFSMDDFGTGYSSLSYLQQLPLAQLKIDQSFVRDLAEDSNDAAIVRAIITLGKSLGLHVIAEGVESEAQSAFLLAHGCHAFQGYLFGRPLPLSEFVAHLEALAA